MVKANFLYGVVIKIFMVEVIEVHLEDGIVFYFMNVICESFLYANQAQNISNKSLYL